jgi:hypothetical protein
MSAEWWCRHRHPQPSFSAASLVAASTMLHAPPTIDRAMEERAQNHAPSPLPKLHVAVIESSRQHHICLPPHHSQPVAVTMSFDMQILLFSLFIKPLPLTPPPPLTPAHLRMFSSSRISVTSLLLLSSHPLLIPFVIPFLSHLLPLQASPASPAPRYFLSFATVRRSHCTSMRQFWWTNDSLDFARDLSNLAHCRSSTSLVG